MICKASIEDPGAIASLINYYGARQIMLPRSLHDIYEHLRDFFVYRESEKVLGCAALHITWQRLAEIRSLAVLEEAQGRGIGSGLVEACLQEARQMGIKRVFALTYEAGFFRRFGFRDYQKEKLPHKIWADCLKCPKFPNCDEQALIIDL